MSEPKPTPHPFFAPEKRVHHDGPFSREEVHLANRNSGMLLEALRHDVTPAGLHYLLIHFDVPYVPAGVDWSLDIGGLVSGRCAFTPMTSAVPAAHPARDAGMRRQRPGDISPRWPASPGTTRR